MLKKKNLKTTQKLHPLYGRKVKGVLTLSLLADRILCQMKRKPDRSGEGVVLEMLFRRIATVGAVGDAIYIVCRRPSDPNGAFNCHKITLQKGPSKAEELAFFLSVYAKNDFMAGSQTVSATVLWCFLCCYILSLPSSSYHILYRILLSTFPVFCNAATSANACYQRLCHSSARLRQRGYLTRQDASSM